MITTYDPEAARLAEYFLAEDDPLVPVTPDRVHGLALAIQTAIEEWFADHPAGQGGPSASIELVEEPAPIRLYLAVDADADDRDA